jgi:N-acetylneuraminic acid mutarotase
VGRLPVPLGHAAAIPLGGRVLVAGGRTGPDAVTDRMWWFDPRTHAVTPAGHLPHPLADSAVAHWGGSFFLVGGETPALSREVLSVSLR